MYLSFFGVVVAGQGLLIHQQLMLLSCLDTRVGSYFSVYAGSRLLSKDKFHLQPTFLELGVRPYEYIPKKLTIYFPLGTPLLH